MKKMPAILWTIGTLAGAWSSLAAQEPQQSRLSQHYHAAKVDRLRNNLWPKPFTAEDTLSVTQMFEAQRNKGWQLYNTLGTPMFDAESHRLTDAGKAQLRWILTYAPPERRVIFVLKGNNVMESALRVESTQLAVSEMLPAGDLPTIYLTSVEARGSSGAYQTAIKRALDKTIPEPRLPKVSAESPAP